MKVGDLILHKPRHGILIQKFGRAMTGILLYDNIEGGTLKLAINEGRVYWAVRTECVLISESR